MKVVSIFFCIGISVSQICHAVVSTDNFGVLKANEMTQGELLWMEGRVGNATYQFQRSKGEICELKVPVAIGRFTRAGLGFSDAQGVMVKVVSERLHQALLKGERVTNRDWKISIMSGESTDLPNDGYIVSGIEQEEGFVFNSRRKWVSWLLDDEPTTLCKRVD
ncbi:hypothetical protein [Vibrio sonorensis]|uniref:hypothetical protein n=1 Tax=Vibrio sonorensis TaxID=1004316 RepID=UPI0008DA9BEA|nr:hypothetical protein [Vibrio sonorensis]